MKKVLFAMMMAFGLISYAQQGVPGSFRVGGSLTVVNNATVKGNLFAGQGWASYADSSSVYGSRQVIAQGDTATLSNNALGSGVTSELPLNVDSLYGSTSAKIQGVTDGDLYLIEVAFTASSDAASGAGKGILYLDVNGSSVVHAPVLFVASDTTSNLQYGYSFVVNVDAAFVANGASVRFYSIAGNTKMYAVRYRIARLQKG